MNIGIIYGCLSRKLGRQLSSRIVVVGICLKMDPWMRCDSHSLFTFCDYGLYAPQGANCIIEFENRTCIKGVSVHEVLVSNTPLIHHCVHLESRCWWSHHLCIPCCWETLHSVTSIKHYCSRWQGATAGWGQVCRRCVPSRVDEVSLLLPCPSPLLPLSTTAGATGRDQISFSS